MKQSRKGFIKSVLAIGGFSSLGIWKGLAREKHAFPFPNGIKGYNPNLPITKDITRRFIDKFSDNIYFPNMIVHSDNKAIYVDGIKIEYGDHYRVRRPVDYSKSVTKEADIGEFL